MNRAAAPPRGITSRAVIIGALLSIIHTIYLVYEECTLGHIGITSAFNPVRTVIGLIFILISLNSLMKRYAPSKAFSPPEIMVVFCMLTLSAIISGAFLLQILFPFLLWPFYIAATNKDYEKLLVHVPNFFHPQSQSVIKEFFIGSRERWRFFAPEIIKEWVVPLLFWAAFLFILVWTMFCIGSIMRKQWVERERLTFPIIELPLMMVKAGSLGSIFGNKLLAGGFAVVFIMISMNNLSYLYPSIPSVPLYEREIGSAIFVNPPYTSMNPIIVCWWTSAIGLCYLMPLDVLFSCWFFYVMIRATTLLAAIFGWKQSSPGLDPGQYPFIHELSSGAWAGLFISVMWCARPHLKHVFRSAFGSGEVKDDESEALSYKIASYGAILGFVSLIAIATVCGMRLYIAVLFFSIFFLVTIVMTRIYSQIAVPIFGTGLFYCSTTMVPTLTGTAGLTASESAVLTSFYWFNFNYTQHPMGHEMESLVLAERLGQRKRGMTLVIVVALGIGIIVGLLTQLQILYDRGASSAYVDQSGTWLAGIQWQSLLSSYSNPQPFHLATYFKIGASMAVVLLLSWSRATWFWFPFHPVGYVFACSGAIEYFWNIILVIWIVKLLVLRYGGLRLYRSSLPLFYGIILGDAIGMFVWGLIMSLLGVKGASAYGHM